MPYTEDVKEGLIIPVFIRFFYTVILDVMSQLTLEQIDLKKPVYGKGRLRMGTMFGNQRPISLTYTQMNREAEKVFGKD